MGIFIGNNGVKTVDDVYSAIPGYLYHIKSIYTNKNGVVKEIYYKPIYGDIILARGLHDMLRSCDLCKVWWKIDNFQDEDPSTDIVFKSVAFGIIDGSKLLMAVGSKMSVYATTDGKSWFSYYSYPPFFPEAQCSYEKVVYGNNSFFTIYRDTDNYIHASISKYMYSMDAISGQISNYVLRGMIAGNGYYIIITSDNKIHKSTDGIDWSSSSLSMQTALASQSYNYTSNQLLFGKGIFIFFNNTGIYYSDANGNNWKVGTGYGTYNIFNVEYGNNVFVACCSGGNVFYSTDGKTWIKSTLTNDHSTFKVNRSLYAANRFILFASYYSGNSWKDELYFSTDGKTWTVDSEKYLVDGYQTSPNQVEIPTFTDMIYASFK